MGQKTHPKGFRLVTTQKHLSDWYSSKVEYSKFLKEDFFIRQKTNDFFKEFLSISTIEINRTAQKGAATDYVMITINALFPREKEMKRKITQFLEEKNQSQQLGPLLANSKGNMKRFGALTLKQVSRNLIRYLQQKTKKTCYIRLAFIRNKFEDANLIARFIAEQLERRVPFRRAVKQTIKKVQVTEIKGLKVEVSGRLNGIEIARSEWKREGKIPLHTLRAKIDYTHYEAQTIYGVIGIKVWLLLP